MAMTDADSTSLTIVKGGRGRAAISEIWRVEQQRLIIWSPALLVIGIWGYFSLSREPAFWPMLLLAVASPCLIVLPQVPRSLKFPLIIALGFSLSALRTHWVATPLLRAYAPQQTVVGYISDIDVRSAKRFTIILDLDETLGFPAEERPRRVRISVTGKQPLLQLGDHIKLTADLSPLPRPAEPGGFDFGRQLYFQSIGAVGRSKQTIELLSSQVPAKYWLRRSFHALRATIGARIREALPGPIGSFADALVTGERASIPRNMTESLQNSGLFHILSISGLHMALVAGGAFWTLRAALAWFPAIALRNPIKKWSALFAIFVGLLYMLLADSGPATERSFIMIAVVFFAILVDRQALSLHNLALAALAILLTAPEQALAASFQMSFMAVMGLAAFFHWWQKRKVEPRIMPKSKVSRSLSWLWRVTLASIATSVVAGLLSGIPAAHHFGRLAPYGVISNALALPIVSVLVMPAAMLSALLMPLGLETLPLKVMGLGLEIVMLISDWVSSWPWSGIRLPQLSAAAAACLAFAAALLMMGQSWLRLLGIPVIVCTIVAATLWPSQTILLVDERAANVALMTEDGLVPALRDKAPANVSRWLTARGDTSGAKAAASRQGWTCQRELCLATAPGFSIAFMPKQAVIARSCPAVDILISEEPLRRRCKGKRLTIDRFDVWRNGAYTVSSDGSVQSVRFVQQQRPWVYEPRARSKK
jgi:competence protein ComEC